MKNLRTSKGFTLIEILVVIVIIATVLSIALLSFNVVRDDQELRTLSKRFMAIVEVAQNDATLQGREFGIEFLTGGYRFVEYDTLLGVWVDVPDDELLRLRQLPEGVEFELYLEGKRILLSADAAELKSADDDEGLNNTPTYSPHLWVFSSGEQTPFELHALRFVDDARLVMRGDALGTMTIVQDDDEIG